MTPGGTVTRKDLIEDEALNYGPQLAKNVSIAIEAQDKLVESAKGYSAVISSMKKAESQQAFLEEKQKERLLYEQTTNAIKLEQTTLKEVEKTKQEVIKTRKLELDALSKEERAKKGAIKLSVEERVQNEANNRVIRQEVMSRLNLTEAYDKLNKKRTEAKNRLRELIATEGASTAEIKKAQKEFDVLAAKVKKADDATNDFSKNVGNYPTIGKLGSSIKDLFGAFGLAAGVGAAAAILKGAYDTIVKFDQGVADLGAITGATGKDLDYLKNQAIELGKETKGGAVNVVEAYKLIASAKPELLENVESLNQVTKAVLTLSKASGLELPDAATALTDAMNQFGAPAEEAGIFIDALANGAKYGSAEIPQVTEALLKFGAVARSSNISIQESTALIELLAENGIKGAEAGTALKNVLLKISAPDALPKEAQQALKDLGISFELLKDKSVPIQEKFEALKPLLDDNGKLLKTFGFENTVAARNIIEHTDRLADLTGKMNEYGTAQAQAEQRSNTLQGKTDKLSATYDSFILNLNSGSGVLSSFLSKVVDFFGYILNNSDKITKTVGYATGAFLIYKTAIIATDTVKKAYTATTIVLAGAKALLTGNIGRASAAMKLLKLEMTSTGIGALVVLVGSLVGAYYSMKKTTEETVEETKKATEEFTKHKKNTQDLQENINNLTKRYEELTNKTKNNKEGTKLNKAEQTELDSIIKQLGVSVPQAVTEFDKYGNALGINTDKVKEFNRQLGINDEQLKKSLIEKTTKDIKNLENQISDLNKVNQGVNGAEVVLEINKETKSFAVRNGVIKEGSFILTQASIEEKIALLEKKPLLNEELRLAKERLLNLKGQKSDTQKLNDEEKKSNSILEENQKRKKEINEANADAEKKREQARRDELSRLKQADDDSYNLLVFRKEQEKIAADEIVSNEKETITDRIDALVLGNDIEQSIAEENAKFKLRQISRYNDEIRDLTDEEIDILVKGLDNKIVLSKAELLVIEQLKAKKKSIDKSEQDKIEKISNDNFKKQVDGIKLIEEEKKKAFENELINLNKSLLNKEITQEAYDAKRKELENQLNKELFDSQLKYLEESVTKLADTNDKKAILEKVLHDLRFGYSESLKNKTISDDKESEEKRKERVAKEKQLLKDTIGENFNILGDALGIETSKTQLFFEGLIDGFKNTADAAKKSLGFISEISGAYFGNRINNIDQEQSKWDEYYNEQIKLAGDDQRQKDLISAEAERKRKELEKEKRKEQHKQAIFNKAMAALNVGINTAQAVMAIASTGGGTFYADFGISAGILTAITLGIGAAQLAAVLAAPLPKYEFGTDWHFGGPAMVGEKRPEVIMEPGKSPYIATSPQILNLAKGTKVIPSLEQYEKEFGQDSINNMLYNSKGKIDNYNNLLQLNFQSKEMVEEMRKTRKAIEKNKPMRPVASKNVDIPHSIWAYSNIKW